MKARNEGDNIATKGFTLMELSIVLILTALISATIMTALDHLSISKAQHIVQQTSKFRIAVTSFMEKYDYLPGDFPDEHNLLPGNPWGGDGNGQLEFVSWNQYEPVLFWQHLALAKMIGGSYTGTIIGADVYVSGVNIPESIIKATAWNTLHTRNISMGGANPDPDDPSSFWSDPQTGIYGRVDNVLELSSPNTSALKGASLNPPTAWAVDNKIDDGGATSGNMYSTNPTITGATGCVGDGTSQTGYNLSNEKVQCSLYFWLTY